MGIRKQWMFQGIICSEVKKEKCYEKHSQYKRWFLGDGPMQSLSDAFSHASHPIFYFLWQLKHVLQNFSQAISTSLFCLILHIYEIYLLFKIVLGNIIQDKWVLLVLISLILTMTHSVKQMGYTLPLPIGSWFKYWAHYFEDYAAVRRQGLVNRHRSLWVVLQRLYLSLVQSCTIYVLLITLWTSFLYMVPLQWLEFSWLP